MAMNPLPSQARLKQLLEYNQSSGVFTWRRRSDRLENWNARFAGTTAIAGDMHGYEGGRIDGQRILAHRIAWKWFYGRDPSELDHINGDKSDNRISNLREVTHLQNCKNRRPKSRIAGVTWLPKKRRWKAFIQVDGATKFLGTFVCFGHALKARVSAQKEHGYYQ